MNVPPGVTDVSPGPEAQVPLASAAARPANQASSPAQVTPYVPPEVTVAGHNLRIFVECPPLFESMLRDIAAAKQRIWLETYIFFHDSGGQAIADALKKRAADGLDVRVLYDAIGSQAAGSGFFHDMQRAGVQVHAYHGLWEAFRHLSPLTIINRRDHRKLLVIDDQVAYFGGMNIIDRKSVGHVHATQPPLTPSAGWRDVHIRMAGPQQSDVSESFDRSWRRAQGLAVTRRPRAYRRGQLPISDESIRFFDSGPGRKHSRAARVFTRLINRSRHRITMSMAYFIPVGRVLRAMLWARRRGVRIRIITPGRSDVAMAQYASVHLYTRLLKRGFRIYLRERRMLHAKVMVVDGQWTVVGSCNMDPRSLWINLEFMAVIRSTALAGEMEKICAYEMQRSQPARREDFAHPRAWTRLRNAVAWKIRWWL